MRTGRLFLVNLRHIPLINVPRPALMVFVALALFLGVWGGFVAWRPLQFAGTVVINVRPWELRCFQREPFINTQVVEVRSKDVLYPVAKQLMSKGYFNAEEVRTTADAYAALLNS